MKKKLQKTRNIMLLAAVIGTIVYTVSSFAFAYVSMKITQTVVWIDPTLTQEFFTFWKWTVTTGAVVAVTGKLKGEEE